MRCATLRAGIAFSRCATSGPEVVFCAVPLSLLFSLLRETMTLHLQLILVFSMWGRLRHLGGVGLVLLGVADNSVIPLPGSMDVLTIWLAASNRHRWFYYAAMAVIGSLIGGYITYILARKGGKEALERKISKRRAEKVYKRFESWGFWAVAIP